MRLTGLLLGVLFTILIAVLMVGQMSTLQDQGELLDGAVGSFFGTSMTLWVILAGLVSVFGLLAVIVAVKR